jgi:ubiquinone/menaquinone biosynthesis C-methylase UbiE
MAEPDDLSREQGQAFEGQMAARDVNTYADFLLPYLGPDSYVLDLGCGDGALSVGLASLVGRLTAVDIAPEDFAEAREYAAAQGLEHLTFVTGDATTLSFDDCTFDAVFCHSVLEAGPDPAVVLAEALRVLKPGGRVGAASVEYGALVLAGPDVDLLRHSNAIREQVWVGGGSDPFLGRELRRLFGDAGFVDVEATSRSLSYGTPELVRVFADGRASECADDEYIAEAVAGGLATEEEMGAMARAWAGWGGSPAAYAAFTWCRAVGRKPASPGGDS